MRTIEEILNFEPRINVQMLAFIFLNGVAFDSLWWIVDIFNHTGEPMIIEGIVYSLVCIGSLTFFKTEFKRLNKKSGD